MTQARSATPAHRESLEALLCTRCGLCCNGSFLADIELAGPREAAALELAGLEIEDDSLLLQPCLALRGSRCSIYAHRPQCCRTFECSLLQRAKSGQISVAQAIQKIDAARAKVKHIYNLLAKLPPTEPRLPLKERCQEALAALEENPIQRLRRISTELENALATFVATANQIFLS